MSDDSIAVIMLELSHIKESQTEMKEAYKEIQREIKESLKAKCDNCPNIGVLRERSKSQWFHIVCLWIAVIGVGSGIVYNGTLIYNHMIATGGIIK